MPFRRKRRTLLGKAFEKHSDTLLTVSGPGTALIGVHTMRDTEVGARDPAGSDDNIQSSRRFGEECNTGDICKYINIHIQAGPRLVDDLQGMGWIEWAFCCHKSSDPIVTKTNIGTNTLGDICTKYFRNECIYTGNLPVSSSGTASQEITLKIPKSKQRLSPGDVWELIFFPRTTSSIDTATNTFQIMTSFNYKNYH